MVMLPRNNFRGFCQESRSPISQPSRASHNAEFLLHRPSNDVASTDFTTVHSTAEFNEQHSRSKMLLAWFSPRANRRGQELNRSQFYARRLDAQPTTETFKDLIATRTTRQSDIRTPAQCLQIASDILGHSIRSANQQRDAACSLLGPLPPRTPIAIPVRGLRGCGPTERLER